MANKFIIIKKELSSKKFVYASSLFGDTYQLPMKKSNRLQPASSYEVSKVAVESDVKHKEANETKIRKMLRYEPDVGLEREVEWLKGVYKKYFYKKWNMI